MSVFIVAYDLNKETKRPQITKALKGEFGTWAMLSESSYAVSTDKTASQVYKVFEPLLDGNDQLYVITLRKPWAGFGPPSVNDWLDAELPG